MTLYPFGILVAIVALAISAKHLNQPITSYYDFVALSVVLGGTLAVALMTLPWEHRRDIWTGFKMLFFHKRPDPRAVLQAGLSVVRDPNKFKPVQNVSKFCNTLFEDGAEMIQLGLNPDTIDAILKERLFQHIRRQKRVANSVRSLAKYPPAFGLMGTVLGLVNLMRGLSASGGASQTGIEMSVALVATMYGLLTANLLVNPAGEMILKKAVEEEELGELALQAVALAARRSSLLEAQEMLNSFVSDSNKINFLSKQIEEQGERVA